MWYLIYIWLLHFIEVLLFGFSRNIIVTNTDCSSECSLVELTCCFGHVQSLLKPLKLK